ncbi:MAG: hypothetical protein QM783_06400 [Phycisphaerales bacterium]
MVTLGAEPSDITILIVVVLCAAVAAVSILLSNERRRRQEAERRVTELARSHAAAGPSPHEAAMFALHKQINELTAAKLRAEVSLLEAQVRVRNDDEDRIQASKEFHELTVEKTKLEIDSLRLHIVELRKRIDDFGLGHD